MTGIAAADVIGRPARDVAARLRRERRRGVAVDGRPQTVPLDLGDRELWLSFSAVRFDEGTVYAFRDLTEERVLEQMRSDFVATVSHELRTPLAAIYGAALTLRRNDLELEEEMQRRLLDVVARRVGPPRADRQRRPARQPSGLGPAAAADRHGRRGEGDEERRRGGADAPSRRRDARRSSAPKRLPPGRRRRAAAAPGAREPRRERGQVLAGGRARRGEGRRAATAASAGRSPTRASASRRRSGGASSRSSTASIRT